MARDPHKVDAAAYNSVVGRTVLRSIRLTDIKFDMKPDALSVDQANWRNSIREEAIEAFLDPENGRLYGIFVFEFVARYRRKRLLSATAHYLVSYRVEGPCDPEVGALFAERVGRVAAYPYFRALVSSLVSQAGLQMPPLPIISAAPRNVNSAKDLEKLGPTKVLAESEKS